MTITTQPPARAIKSLAGEADALLSTLGVKRGRYTGGTLIARSPITGEIVGACQGDRSPPTRLPQSTRRTRPSSPGALVPAPKRGELVRLLGEELRANKAELGRLVIHRSRQDRVRRPRRSAGDDRHLRFRGRPSRQLYGLTIATERPDHRMMETWHPLGVAGIISAFNFPVAVWSWNAALALVCGNSIVWKPSEKTPLTALADAGAVRARAMTRFGDGGTAPDGLSTVLIGGRDVGEVLVDNHGCRWSRRPARPRWAAPSARGWPSASPAPSSSSAATMPRSSRPPPISTWRCAASPSPPWARRASAARRCAACSCMTASTTRSCRA